MVFHELHHLFQAARSHLEKIHALGSSVLILFVFIIVVISIGIIAQTQSVGDHFGQGRGFDRQGVSMIIERDQGDGFFFFGHDGLLVCLLDRKYSNNGVLMNPRSFDFVARKEWIQRFCNNESATEKSCCCYLSILSGAACCSESNPSIAVFGTRLDSHRDSKFKF